VDKYRLRDRDAIVSREGIIFRVYGYWHLPRAYVCDPEYAHGSIYKSENPRAYRAEGKQVYYKFYADEGLKFICQNYPRHTVWAKPLSKRLVAVHKKDVWEKRQPEQRLQSLVRRQPTDSLLKALHSVLDLITQRSNLSLSDFGVFGSLLHGFYHPEYSDLDFTVYGRDKLSRLTETLTALYKEARSLLRNEYADAGAVENKQWKFANYSKREYLQHQAKKRIYGVINHKQSGRRIKVEFEPIKPWDEINSDYTDVTRISQEGWVKLKARVTDARDAAFMPSAYQIEPVRIIQGARVHDLRRILSFVEEFRLQAEQDDLVLVEGNLEKVLSTKETFHQVTLTHGPRYYEQTLKIVTDH
jgi:predicted nucleotidyltransferase